MRKRAKFAQGKFELKKSFTPINPKKYSCYGLKKIRTRNVLTEKDSFASKILTPDNFSHGPSLNNTAPEYLTAWRFGRPQPRTELF